MTCIAMQPLITSCCYEGMRMLHAVRPAQRRRPRDGAAGIRAAPEGRRFKEAAAAHPAATRQGTVVGWPPRRCGEMAGHEVFTPFRATAEELDRETWRLGDLDEQTRRDELQNQSKRVCRGDDGEWLVRAIPWLRASV